MAQSLDKRQPSPQEQGRLNTQSPHTANPLQEQTAALSTLTSFRMNAQAMIHAAVTTANAAYTYSGAKLAVGTSRFGMGVFSSYVQGMLDKNAKSSKPSSVSQTTDEGATKQLNNGQGTDQNNAAKTNGSGAEQEALDSNTLHSKEEEEKRLAQQQENKQHEKKKEQEKQMEVEKSSLELAQ